ncbi:MAG: Asp-tRNA(Asn) amidotransferase GatCAB subunit C [Hadesarchaea archaeon]|nr:Asp-tRNA(Asn) amidotransferase GatCAB subunit C [Hadesarchaea archaeon]
MSEERLTEIKESAEEIVDSFKKAAEDLPKEEETYYGQNTLNVLRSDAEPSSESERLEFKKRFKEIMPESDEEGNLKVEIGDWTE